jgi:hypothetical protein
VLKDILDWIYESHNRELGNKWCKMYTRNEIQDCHGKRSIQEVESSFHQQSELKFKEEASKVLHLERSFVVVVIIIIIITIIIIIISVMELGHLLTRSGLTYPEASSKLCHDSFCQSGSSVSLPWVIYYETFYLHVVSSFSCIPVMCPNLVLFLTPLQFVYLFCNLSKCILLFFS